MRIMNISAGRNGQSQRSAMVSFGFWLVAMLASAALVHFLVVLTLPIIGRGVLVEQVLAPGDEGPVLYSDPQVLAQLGFRYSDARQDSAYCAFDLRDGAVRVSGELDVPFWSLSVHTLSGLVVGSVNHRAASGGQLALVVMTPQLGRELAESGAVMPPDTLVVVMNQPVGIVRISGLASYGALRPALQEQLASTTCQVQRFSFVAPQSQINQQLNANEDDLDSGQSAPIPSPTPRPDLDQQ